MGPEERVGGVDGWGGEEGGYGVERVVELEEVGGDGWVVVGVGEGGGGPVFREGRL